MTSAYKQSINTLHLSYGETSGFPIVDSESRGSTELISTNWRKNRDCVNTKLDQLERTKSNRKLLPTSDIHLPPTTRSADSNGVVRVNTNKPIISSSETRRKRLLVRASRPRSAGIKSNVKTWAESAEPSLLTYLNDTICITPKVENITREFRSGYLVGYLLHAIGRPIPLSRLSKLQSHAAIEHNYRILGPHILSMDIKFNGAALNKMRKGICGPALWLVQQIAQQSSFNVDTQANVDLQNKSPNLMSVSRQESQKLPHDLGHIVRNMFRSILLSIPAVVGHRAQTQLSSRTRILEIMQHILPTVLLALTHTQRVRSKHEVKKKKQAWAKSRHGSVVHKHLKEFRWSDCMAQFLLRNNPRRQSKPLKHYLSIGGHSQLLHLTKENLCSAETLQKHIVTIESNLRILLKQEFLWLRASDTTNRFKKECDNLWAKLPTVNICRHGITSEVLHINQLEKNGSKLLGKLFIAEGDNVTNAMGLHNAEMVAMMKTVDLDSQQKFFESIVSLLRACDVDSSGTIQFEEFRLVIEQQLVADEVAKYMRFHGYNNAQLHSLGQHNGTKISELQSFLSRLMERKLRQLIQKTNMSPSVLFKRFDTSGDGLIDVDEMQRGFVSIGLQAFPAKHLFTSTSLNPKAITQKEFIDFLGEFLSPAKAMDFKLRHEEEAAVQRFHTLQHAKFQDLMENITFHISKACSRLSKIKNLNKKTALTIQKAMLVGVSQGPAWRRQRKVVSPDEIDVAQTKLIIASLGKHEVMQVEKTIQEFIDRIEPWSHKPDVKLPVLVSTIADMQDVLEMAKGFETLAESVCETSDIAFKLALQLEQTAKDRFFGSKAATLASIVNEYKHKHKEEIAEAARLKKLDKKLAKQKNQAERSAKQKARANAKVMLSSSGKENSGDKYFPWVAKHARRFDDDKTVLKAFKSDWQRLSTGKSYKTWVKEWCGNSRKDSKNLYLLLQEHFQALTRIFHYYSHTGKTTDNHFTTSVYYQFLNECNILDSGTCPRRACMVCFQRAHGSHKQKKIKSKNSKSSRKDSILRSNFMELLLHLGVEKYAAVFEDIPAAIRHLIEDDILYGFEDAHPSAAIPADVFRREKLYTHEVKQLLQSLVPVLEQLFEAFSVPATGRRHTMLLRAQSINGEVNQLPEVDTGAGEESEPNRRRNSSFSSEHYDDQKTRTRNMMLRQWLLFLERAGIMGYGNFSQRQAQTCFYQSLIMLPDEILQEKHIFLDFKSFVEALARVADTVSFPNLKDLRDLKLTRIIDYNQVTYGNAVGPSDAAVAMAADKTALERRRSKLIKGGRLQRQDTLKDLQQQEEERQAHEKAPQVEDNVNKSGLIAVPSIRIPSANVLPTQELPFPIRFLFLLQMIFWAFDNKPDSQKDGRVSLGSVRMLAQSFVAKRCR